MNILRWFIPALVIGLLLGAGASVVSADISSPTGAAYVDNATHMIPPDSSTWSRFEYAGDNSQILVLLPDGKNSGLGFEVFTPAEMQRWWETDPVGVGAVHRNDLVWTGNANERGTWFILVTNKNAAPVPYKLVVTGDGVAFAAPPVNSGQAPSALVETTENAVPEKALIVSPAQQVIPAGRTMWYRFPYDGTRDQATITIPNGADNNLRVHVHTPEQIEQWWDVSPIGQATPKGPDLVWSGNSNQAGDWYVEVMNNNPYPVGFQVLLRVVGTNLPQ
jgi:hypothetical protein